jgi:uncharacterized membrane protein YfcA
MLEGFDVLLCAPMLFLAGLLCSAGGIGGGGVYVTLLMVVGHLAPRDAVPLSKAIVFLGSLSSLALNLRKMAMASPSDPHKSSLIDYNICRIVVPSALIGTLLGVVLNRLAADWIIVTALCLILGGMTVLVARTAAKQYHDEEQIAKSSGDAGLCPFSSGTAGYDTCNPMPWSSKKGNRGSLSKHDVCLGLAMLSAVVMCGIFRAHASACASELQLLAHGPHPACRHPVMALFFRNTFEGWMSKPVLAEVLKNSFLVLPICTCLAVMIYNSRICIVREGWTWQQVALFESMGVTTGCLAGLVGIGGGLIFSPFFLVLGVEPHVAVATSSTCVIFTSSSTTLQYLFTDRIIPSLALVYGAVNLLASSAGTSFVHFLQDNFQTRKSYITMIVAMGVCVSACLSVAKLFDHASTPSPHQL